MDRAYSLVHVKGVDDEQRIITGWASTPEADRAGDEIVMAGLRFASDVPLFLYHDSTKTVGRAKFGKPTPDGLPFEATLPRIAEEGVLRERIEEAWQLVKYKLVTSVSIGFNPLSTRPIPGGGIRYEEAELLELSIVPIPMNAGATINTVRALVKHAPRAGSGTSLPLVNRSALRDVMMGSLMDAVAEKKPAAQAVAIAVQHGLRHLADHVDQVTEHVERRLAEAALDTMRQIEQRSAEMRYVGVWQHKTMYRKGNFCTFAGSLWACLSDTQSQPPGTDWQLCVQRGRDAR